MSNRSKLLGTDSWNKQLEFWFLFKFTLVPFQVHLSTPCPYNNLTIKKDKMNLSTTSSTIELSREQLLKVLTTAFGLLDEHGGMYGTNEVYIFEDQGTFELVPFEDCNEILPFSLDGASADGSNLILQTPHGEIESFEVLVTSQVKDLLN